MEEVYYLNVLKQEIEHSRPTQADIVKLKSLSTHLSRFLKSKDFKKLNTAREKLIEQLQQDVTNPISYYIMLHDAHQMPFFFHTAKSSFLFHLGRFIKELSKISSRKGSRLNRGE